LICHNPGVARRLGPALAGILVTLALGGCGGGAEDESPTIAQGPSSTGAATPPAVPPRIVALTEGGDVVIVDREAEETRIIASFPPREDPQVAAGSFRAVDIVALPDGRILLATCCEPAAGHMYALAEDGRRLKDQDLFAEDAGHDAQGTRVASGELVGLVIRPLSDLNSAAYTLALPPDLSGFSPDNISWSTEEDRVAFTLGGRLAVVDVSAESLADATYVEAPAGSHWAGAASTSDGTVAVEQGGDPLHPSGPSRLLRVDMESGESSELVSTQGRISDLAVDPSGSYLLWVEGGRLRWLANGGSTTLPGNFIAAGWMMDSA
jgi:hypothetical protein